MKSSREVREMKELGIQKVWFVGKTPVLTIPAEVRPLDRAFSQGGYVRVYAEGKRIIIEPVEPARHH